MIDHELLAQFAQTRSQDAFAQLVRRHIDWLHSAALRLIHDPALAQDVTQAVFLVLAQKAPYLKPSTPLAPWLFRVLQYVASNARRAEARRKNHESEAAAMRPSATSTQDSPDWSDVAPLLEPAVAQLPAPDRTAILLRFYQQLSLPDVGTALGITEEAARKRVTRAVDRLRLLLTRKRAGKTTLPAAVLAALLLENTAHAAPAALTSAAAGLGTGVASANILTLAKGALAMLLRTQVQLVAICAAAILVAGALGVAAAQSVAGQSAPSATVTASTPTTATSPIAGNANPLYAAWKGHEGKSVTFTRQETISGGAPDPGQASRARRTSTITCLPFELAADHATIRVTRGPGDTPVDTLTLPATFAANDPAAPKPAGTENLRIGDKTYACTKYTYTTSNPVEIGRDPQGLRASITVWLADGVPGGVVQRKISLTIRASYDITDVLSATGTLPANSVAGPGTAAGVVATASATAAAPLPAPARAIPFDQYEGYFVVNTFEPNNPRSFIVVTDQAAFEKIFNMAVVMGDRSHRLPAGIFEKSLVVAPVKRGPFTSYSQISTTLQDGILTLRYTTRQDAPGTATYTTPLILSVPKAGVKTVVFVENGAKVAEKPLNP